MSAAQDIAARIAKSFEGFVAHPYQDATGIWTQGYGSTRDSSGQPITPVSPNITESEALTWLERDMSAAFAEIAHDVKVPLTVNETAAIADFIYNVGAGNFRSSTLLRLLNIGRYDLAAAQLDKWDIAGGQVLAGLLRRRQVETTVFHTSDQWYSLPSNLT